MPNKSKIKGNNYERWIVNFFQAIGLLCRRAWGSDGRSMGLTEGVDGTLNDEYKWQAKCKAQISPTMTVEKLGEMIVRLNELYQHNESLEAENKDLKDALVRELK